MLYTAALYFLFQVAYLTHNYGEIRHNCHSNYII